MGSIRVACHGLDGVMIYRHQAPKANAEKFDIVKRLFNEWKTQAR
jgi:hypothetical protein